MAYRAQAEFERAVPLLNAGITVHVRKNDLKIGRLLISQGGVKWLRSPKSKRGPDISWEKLVGLLEESARAKRH